jgi:hypothetical protein
LFAWRKKEKVAHCIRLIDFRHFPECEWCPWFFGSANPTPTPPKRNETTHIYISVLPTAPSFYLLLLLLLLYIFSLFFWWVEPAAPFIYTFIHNSDFNKYST